jgi:hypothetical protein
MRAGSSTLHLLGSTIVDTGSSGRSTLNIPCGWFFLRLLLELTVTQKDDFATHGIQFTAQHFIQPGWFKLYLDEQQVSYLQSLPTLVSLLPVKKHVQPNFSELQGENSFLVQATEDWNPTPPIIAQKTGRELYTVRGASAEEIFRDPKVASVSKRPKIVLHGD